MDKVRLFYFIFSLSYYVMITIVHQDTNSSISQRKPEILQGWEKIARPFPLVPSQMLFKVTQIY